MYALLIKIKTFNLKVTVNPMRPDRAAWHIDKYSIMTGLP